MLAVQRRNVSNGLGDGSFPYSSPLVNCSIKVLSVHAEQTLPLLHVNGAFFFIVPLDRHWSDTCTTAKIATDGLFLGLKPQAERGKFLKVPASLCSAPFFHHPWKKKGDRLPHLLTADLGSLHG